MFRHAASAKPPSNLLRDKRTKQQFFRFGPQWKSSSLATAAGRSVAPLRAFNDLIARIQTAFNGKRAADFLRFVLDETGYMEMLKDRNSPEDVARIENLQELTRAVAESTDAGESFTDFLDAAALVSDADSFEGKPGVTLITLAQH